MKKIFRDIVHDYTSFSARVTRKIIDSPIFQRLAYIRQGACKFVYPCANHTRFEHSLGTSYLADRICKSILSNTHSDKKSKQIVNDNRLNIKLAALCHDLGHAPFSHMGEVFYKQNDLISQIANLKTCTNEEKKYLESAANHELMSGLIVLKYDKIRDVFKAFHTDTNFAFDMICGNYHDRNSARNFLIQILHSNMDADRIDYVLRDNCSSGAGLVAVDTNRLLNGYLACKNLLRIDHRASSSIASFIHGRSIIYEWIINHHKSVLLNGIIGCYIDHLLHVEASGTTIEGLHKGIDKFAKYFTYVGVVDYKIDDIDVLTVFKNNCDIDPKTKIYYRHIFERNHFRSLWKTPVEFERIFVGKSSAMRKVIMFNKIPKPTKYYRLTALEEIIKAAFPALDKPRTETIFAFKCESRYYKDLPTEDEYNQINIFSKKKGIGDYDFGEIFEGRLQKHISEYPYIYIKKDIFNKYRDDIIKFLRNQ